MPVVPTPLWDLMAPIKLSPEDEELAIQYAKFRQESKDKAGVIDRKYSPEDGYVLHLRGVRVEIAVARLWGLEPHQLDSIYGDGGGHDYVLCGKTISVKSINDMDYFIRVFFPATPRQWPVRADIVVAYKAGDLIKPLGFQTRQWIIEHAHLHASYRGPSYVIFIHQLRPMSELPMELAVETDVATELSSDTPQV
jgi:hypothetical protein